MIAPNRIIPDKPTKSTETLAAVRDQLSLRPDAGLEELARRLRRPAAEVEAALEALRDEDGELLA